MVIRSEFTSLTYGHLQNAWLHRMPLQLLIGTAFCSMGKAEPYLARGRNAACRVSLYRSRGSLLLPHHAMLLLLRSQLLHLVLRQAHWQLPTVACP